MWPGFDSRPGVICGLSLLLVLVLASRVFVEPYFGIILEIFIFLFNHLNLAKLSFAERKDYIAQLSVNSR